METTTIKKTISWWDWTGVFFSSLCLVHCVATPIILASAPLWVASEWVHVIFLIALVPITFIASRRAYRVPRRYSVIFFLTTGLAVLIAAVFVEESMGEFAEIGLTIVGSLLLIVGHLKNRHCP